MVESKEGHSRFIPYKNNIVRFSVDAFLFKGMTGKVSKDALCYCALAMFCDVCRPC